MTLQGLVSCGVTDITVVDVMDNRLELAAKLGAAHTVNGMKEDTVAVCRAYTDDMGADYVFETAGAVVTARQAVQIVARGGKIMQVGTQSKEVPVDFLKINREVTIQTSFRYRNCYPAVIAAISSGRFDVRSMVTASYDYKDVQQAFEDSVNKKAEIIKSVIHMPEE
jgi:L-iditol 2-dehydrogenase